MSKQRLYILIAASAGIIGLFLPWATVSIFGISQSTNGFHSFGIMVFLAFAATAIIAFIGDQQKILEKNMWLAALATAAVAILFTIIFMANISGAFGGFLSAGIGLGSWLSLIAAIGVLVIAWRFKNPADNLKEGLESLKKTVSDTMANNNKNEPGVQQNTPTNRIAELEKLIALKISGHISEEEYQELKSKLL